MAKNLTSRFRKIFKPMVNENSDNTEHTEDLNPIMEANQPENEVDAAALSPEQPLEGAENISEEDKWKSDAAEWKDKYLRLFAEFDNFRKRSIRERHELLVSASGDVIKDLLTVVDDFDRAIRANEGLEDIDVVKEGFSLIHNKMMKRLEAKGLKPIDAQGKPFDTDFHESITQIPAPSEELKGKVLDEVEKGYLLNDKVLRFSKVVIGQ
jgi:molecular chaperone GrpE